MGEATYIFDDELRTKNGQLLDYIRSGLGEFGSVFIIIFLSCMGCTVGMSKDYVPVLQMAITGGISVMTIIQIFGHISGAHANPAVTLSAWFMGVIDSQKALLYVVCQIFGGLTGYAFLLFITPKEFTSSPTHCVTQPSENISMLQAFLVEVAITFILCIAINTAWDERCANKHDSFSIRIGLIVTGCVLAAGPYTGASMNPARSIGPAVWQKNANALQLYIFGPLLGGGLSGLFYKHVLLSEN